MKEPVILKKYVRVYVMKQKDKLILALKIIGWIGFFILVPLGFITFCSYMCWL